MHSSFNFQDHSPCITTQLRSRAYTDAVLVSEDGHAENVHRLVLSAASSYLAAVLKETGCTTGATTDYAPLTTFILPIDGKTLEKLVRFVYNGEIELRDSDVEDFLDAGRWLGIKGLTGHEHEHGHDKRHEFAIDRKSQVQRRDRVSADEQQQQHQRESPVSTTSSLDSIPAFNIERIQTLASLLAAGSAPPPAVGSTDRDRDRDRGERGDRGAAADRLAKLRQHDVITADIFKTDPHTHSNNTHTTPGGGGAVGGAGLDLVTGGGGTGSGGRASSPLSESAVRDFNQRLRATDPRPCPKCGKVYRSAHTLRTHLEDKHTVCPGYRCVLCGTIAKSRNSLHSHMSRQHRGISTKDLPLVEVARGPGGGGGGSLDGRGGSEFDGAGQGSGERGANANKKHARMDGGGVGGAAAGPFGDIIQPPNLPGGLMKPTTTGSAILDTYLHFIAENSLAAAAAFGGGGGGGSGMSNNTGSDMESDDENGYGGGGGVGTGQGLGLGAGGGGGGD